VARLSQSRKSGVPSRHHPSMCEYAIGCSLDGPE
jgi:hypothetical protein